LQQYDKTTFKLDVMAIMIQIVQPLLRQHASLTCYRQVLFIGRRANARLADNQFIGRRANARLADNQ